MHASVKTGIALTAAALALAACEQPVKAPLGRGQCYHMVSQGSSDAERAEPKFNQLPGYYQSLEYCAAGLEQVRLTGMRGEINGAYQGQFVWINRRGIYVSQGYEEPRYLALVRTGDGRLVVPGAQNR
jgi:hypothetical protein